MKNSKLKPYQVLIDIISPSLIGIEVYAVIITVLIASYIWEQNGDTLSSLQASSFKGTFLYGYVNDFSNLIKSNIFNDVMLYVFWVIVGILIYFIASRIVSNVGNITDDIIIRHYIWPKGTDNNAPLKEYSKRIVFHLSLLIVLIIYLIKVPPLIEQWLQSNKVFSEVTNLSGWYLLEFMLFIFLFYQGIVVILRLLATRRRLIE